MESAQQKAKFATKIKSIDLISFEAKEITDDINPTKVNFFVQYNIGENLDHTEAYVDCLIKIFKDKTRELLLGSIATRGEYFVKYENYEPKEYLPIQVMATILGTQISTTRGMLIILSKGTPFARSFFPIINPLQAIKRGMKNQEKSEPTS
jgi:hypothetical protein